MSNPGGMPAVPFRVRVGPQGFVDPVAVPVVGDGAGRFGLRGAAGA